MSNELYDFNLGHSTAYAYAKASGDLPEGMTPAEYGELLAAYATVGQTAVDAKDAAVAANTAAQTAATTATTKASEAATSATTATTAAEAAQADADAAALDASQALSAASTATSKAAEATTAAATAVSAKDDAVSANTAAQSAKTAAQTAQTGAETAATSVQSSAAQITQNAEDITALKEDFGALLNTPFDKFYNHISNPLVKTSVKMVGNSITAGLGGTGYSATDETIIGSSQKTNVKTAICWANMLYHYLIDNFAGEKIVEANDPKITTFGMYQVNMNIVNGSQQITHHSMYTTNTVAKKMLEFDFYGTGISVIYSKAAVYGIFDIYVDGEKKQSVDCYASSTTHGTVLGVDGLSDGNHTISIYSTDTKNDASSGKQFYIHGFIVNKSIEWHNYGISGSAVNAGINANGRYTNEDDFVFIMYGTNNRVTTATYRGFITEYKQLYDFLVDTYGITPIIISPPPASEAQDTTNTNTTYMFHTYNLQMAIREIADYYKVPFIDVYNGFLEYADSHDIDYTTLLADGLHPNNNGYNVIYHKVIKDLGLPLMPHYKEWYQPT